MRRLIIKIILFLVILNVALFDYRLLSIKDGKLLVANWHQITSWQEVEESVIDLEKAEVYPTRISRRGHSDETHYLVLYMDNTFYNIKATDLEIERIKNLMNREQVDIVEVEPLDAWFYGLLVVLLIVFPVMRKEELTYS